MKKFFLKSLLIAPLIVIPVYFYLLLFGNGRIDEFYKKFTTPSAPSLILGTSRATQGIQPSVFNESAIEFKRPLQNFGFANIISLYGPGYYKAITRKILPGYKNGLFLLEVSPMSITVKRNKENGKAVKLEEQDYEGWKIDNVNTNPNLEYIFKAYDAPLYTIFYRSVRNDKNFVLRNYFKSLQSKSAEVRDDGFFEVSLPMDSASLASRKAAKLDYFKGYLLKREFSDIRMQYLIKTIKFLQEHGKVILVRMPIDQNFLQIEDSFMPLFNQKMENLCALYKLRYIDLSPLSGNYSTLDAEHLTVESSKQVSLQILKHLQGEGEMYQAKR